MNRRDMIIVAALINAGLLIVLFIGGVTSERRHKNSSLSKNKQRIFQEEKISIEPVKAVSVGDQIDQVISEYSAKVAEKEKITKPKSLPLPVFTPEPKIAKAEETPKMPLKQELEESHTVIVEKGDVLERIARQNGVSVEELMKLNNLVSSRLQIGQVLKLPKKEKTKATKKPNPMDGKYYIVRGGDNPWTIAQKNGMQLEELLELNNMDDEKAKKLRPGDKLRIK